MDRDEGKRRPEDDKNYGADPAYSETAPPPTGAPADYGQDQTFGAEGDWQGEPVDDFVDEAEVHEAIYEDELAEPTAAMVKEDEQNANIEEAVEEEYYQQLPEEEKAAIVAEARSKKAMSFFGEKTFIKRYMPYFAGGAVLLLLGFFGFQQFAEMFREKPGPLRFPKLEKSLESGNDEVIDNPDNERNRALTQSEHKDMAYAEPEALAPAAPPEPPPPEKLNLAPPKPLGPDIITPVTGAAPAPRSTLESQLADLTIQLQEIKNSQNQIRQDIEAKSAEQAASAAKALEERMAQLEERMSTVSVTRPAAKPVPSTDAPRREKAPAPGEESSTALPAPEKEQEPEARRAPRKETTVSRAKKKGPSTDFMASQLQREMNTDGNISRTPTSPPPVAVAPAPGPVYMPMRPVAPAPPIQMGSGWALRSAQPGAAWISEGMSSRLRRIVPGDKVPGLGTIISVHQFAGRWVIEGTQGSVR